MFQNIQKGLLWQVAASLYQTLVSVWVADLMRLKPFSSSSSADNASDDNAVHRVLR